MPITWTMSRPVRITVLAARVVLGAGVLLEFARTGLHLDGAFGNIVDQWVYDPMLLLAAAICAARTFAGGRGRYGWLALGAGIASWAAGDVYYTHWLYNDPNPPYPSLADAGYLAFLPLAYVGFILLIKERVPKLTPGVWLDGVTAGLAVGAVSAAVVLQAVLSTTSGNVATVATNLSYPLGDALLLAMVVAAFSLTRWQPGGAWLLLGAGLAVFAIADSIYLYQAANDTYVDGSLIDATWPAGIALLANAAWVGETGRTERRSDVEGRSLLIVPASCVAIAVGVLVLDHFSPLNPLALVLAVATLAFVVARLAITFRENRRLFELTRYEAVTDPLTGLGNRRQLMNQLEDVLAHATPDDAWILVIFDLDGFKGYNDTFGHPAGDALLQHLGIRLAAVPGAGGAAYRLGGDEFCLLAPIRDVAVDQLLDHAISALSDRGDGFEIGRAHV